MDITGDQPTDVRLSMATGKPESATDSTIAKTVAEEELPLIEALRRGHEAAFLLLVEQFHATMIRIARSYVSNIDMAKKLFRKPGSASCAGLTTLSVVLR